MTYPFLAKCYAHTHKTLIPHPRQCLLLSIFFLRHQLFYIDDNDKYNITTTLIIQFAKLITDGWKTRSHNSIWHGSLCESVSTWWNKYHYYLRVIVWSIVHEWTAEQCTLYGVQCIYVFIQCIQVYSHSIQLCTSIVVIVDKVTHCKSIKPSTI